jgi:hypothetical protein
LVKISKYLFACVVFDVYSTSEDLDLCWSGVQRAEGFPEMSGPWSKMKEKYVMGLESMS